eukprot:jgi/Tetstr1/453820/TSEL_040771.t1
MFPNSRATRAASFAPAGKPQKSKTAAQPKKLTELHAHCGELLLTVEAEDSKWRKLYRTKKRNHERFGIATAELEDIDV